MHLSGLNPLLTQPTTVECSVGQRNGRLGIVYFDHKLRVMFVPQRYQHCLLGIMYNPEGPFTLTPVGTYCEKSGKAVCQPWETGHQRPAHLQPLANSDDVFEGNRDPALVEGTESVKPRYLNNEILADHRNCRHERIVPFVPMDSLSPGSDYTGWRSDSLSPRHAATEHAHPADSTNIRTCRWWYDRRGDADGSLQGRRGGAAAGGAAAYPDGVKYLQEARTLWQTSVPLRGQASTVPGELFARGGEAA